MLPVLPGRPIRVPERSCQSGECVGTGEGTGEGREFDAQVLVGELAGGVPVMPVATACRLDAEVCGGSLPRRAHGAVLPVTSFLVLARVKGIASNSLSTQRVEGRYT